MSIPDFREVISKIEEESGLVVPMPTCATKMPVNNKLRAKKSVFKLSVELILNINILIMC